eukprot:gnl/Chilomastix_caulleri/1074.p1 GENE.gnl/Chilomastix_caulleri/1074~~gnl/Chilomastix_caulleri/1074.p1  ORF type:complete len:184 (+),score=35.32 gnl/Chilomastix_caulleri/1074:3-554(+)
MAISALDAPRFDPVRGEQVLNKRVRDKLLLDTFKCLEINKCIVFVSKVKDCEDVTKLLTEQGVSASYTHGEFDPTERARRFTEFRSTERTRVLVSTDMLGRGVDIPTVAVILCYSFKSEINHESLTQYIHRAGRTSRFGARGTCISIACTEADVNVLEYIAKSEKLKVNRFTIPEFVEFNIKE